MVAYSFKQQFREPIVAGTKRQTIRKDRKRHARQGEELQLYTGMRTRQCALIGRAVCIAAAPIHIHVEDGCAFCEHPGIIPETMDAFAQADGFTDWPAMRAFWRHEHPDKPVFSGVIIRWKELVS